MHFLSSSSLLLLLAFATLAVQSAPAPQGGRGIGDGWSTLPDSFDVVVKVPHSEHDFEDASPPHMMPPQHRPVTRPLLIPGPIDRPFAPPLHRDPVLVTRPLMLPINHSVRPAVMPTPFPRPIITPPNGGWVMAETQPMPPTMHTRPAIIEDESDEADAEELAHGPEQLPGPGVNPDFGGEAGEGGMDEPEEKPGFFSKVKGFFKNVFHRNKDEEEHSEPPPPRTPVVAAPLHEAGGAHAPVIPPAPIHNENAGAELGEKCDPKQAHPCKGHNSACVNSKILFLFNRHICATNPEAPGALNSPCEGPDQPLTCGESLICKKKHFWKGQKRCLPLDK